MSKKNILAENMERFGTKNMLNEHVLGQLPSEKLMKMKWKRIKTKFSQFLIYNL